MYVYQNGKLYKEIDGKLVGVEIYLDKGTVLLDGEVAEKSNNYELCTKQEVICRFHIDMDNPYIFPREVSDNEPTNSVKIPRKYNRK